MISIIVPVYNVEQYLPKCIRSILAQTFRDFELLLIDNGSTDHSAEICRNYAGQDARVLFLQTGKRGVSAARNTGIAKAEGEYLSFVDADDWLSPLFYEELIKCAAGNADVICCDYKTARRTDLYGHGRYVVENAKTWRSAPPVFDVTGADKYNALFARSPYVWNKLFARSAIGQTRFREDLDYGEDMLFLLEVLKHSGVCRVLNRPFYYYRKNRAGSITNSSDITRSCRYLCALEKAYRILSEAGAGAAGVCRLANGSMAVARAYDCMKMPPAVLRQIRHGVNAVTLRDMCSFLTEPSFSPKEKAVFLLLKADPRIASAVRHVINSLPVKSAGAAARKVP